MQVEIHALGRSKHPNWEKSMDFAQWFVSFHEILRTQYAKSDKSFDFCQYTHFVYTKDRGLVEPNLN